MQIHTWDLLPLPATHKVVGCKWLYMLKFKPDDSFEMYKAQLDAKGYHQTRH